MNTEQRDALRVQRVLDLLAGRDLSRCRVLDLASRIGVFVAALAAAGADVVGIEGRQSNITQADADTRNRIVQDDVRNLSFERYGSFDVSLCLGVLYHLEAEDAVSLLRTLRQVTTGMLIVDTHIGGAAEAIIMDGAEYTGMHVGDSDDPWGAIGNSRSWRFTPESLVAALDDAGFAAIERIGGKAYPDEPDDRVWYVAQVSP